MFHINSADTALPIASHMPLGAISQMSSDTAVWQVMCWQDRNAALNLPVGCKMPTSSSAMSNFLSVLTLEPSWFSFHSSDQWLIYSQRYWVNTISSLLAEKTSGRRPWSFIPPLITELRKKHFGFIPVLVFMEINKKNHIFLYEI